jgi:opacity protein-like surface antigen
MRRPLLGTISMRRLFLSAVLALSALPAVAADMAGPPPVLRGALPASAGVDWTGAYFGGFAGYNAQSFASRNTLGTLAQNYATTRYGIYGDAETARYPGRTSSNAFSFGVFAGYNWGLDGYIFGLEADYTRSRLKGSGHGEVSGTFTDPTTAAGGNISQYAYTSRVNYSLDTTDYGTIRARIGMPIDNMMPYVTGGFAWARTGYSYGASIAGQVRTIVQATGVPVTPYVADPTAPGPFTSARKTDLIFGYAFGAGVEFALTSNVLLRGEAMTMRFSEFGGGGSKRQAATYGVPDGVTSINTIRGGAAIKF